MLLKTIFKYIETIWQGSVANPDLQERGEPGHPDPEIRKWKGGGGRSPTLFSALRASVWSKNKGGRTPRAPPLDPPLRMVKSEY